MIKEISLLLLVINDGQARGSYFSLEGSKSARECGGALLAPPARSGAEFQPKSNLVHFSLKI